MQDFRVVDCAGDDVDSDDASGDLSAGVRITPPSRNPHGEPSPHASGAVAAHHAEPATAAEEDEGGGEDAEEEGDEAGYDAGEDEGPDDAARDGDEELCARKP